MAPLNQAEQEKIARLEELQRQRATGERYVSDGMLAEAERLAGFARLNAEARQAAQQQRQAEADAQAARHRERVDQQASQAQEAYLREARLRYPGTEEQWQRDKDEICRQWRIRHALGEASDMDAAREQKRRQFEGLF